MTLRERNENISFQNVLVSEGLTVNLNNFVYNLTVDFVKNLSVEHIGKIGINNNRPDL